MVCSCFLWAGLEAGLAVDGLWSSPAAADDDGAAEATLLQPQDVVPAVPVPPIEAQPVAGMEDYTIVVTSLSRATFPQSTARRWDVLKMIWPRCEVTGLGRLPRAALC